MKEKKWTSKWCSFLTKKATSPMLRNKQVKLGNKISFVVAHGTRNANSKKKIHQKAGFNRIPNSKKLGVILRYSRSTENGAPSFRIYGGVRSLNSWWDPPWMWEEGAPFHYTPRLPKNFPKARSSLCKAVDSPKDKLYWGQWNLPSFTLLFLDPNPFLFNQTF